MRYEVILAPEAVGDLRHLNGNVRAAVRDGMERHLRHEPTKVSKSRIKRLRACLTRSSVCAIEDVRVFYDVTATTVEVLAVVSKAESEAWLAEAGKAEPRKENPDEESGAF